MQRKKALIAGIIGGGIGGIVGGYIGTVYGEKYGFNPFFVALITGVLAISFAVILSKIFK